MKKVAVFGGSGLVGSRFIELNQKFFEINAPQWTQINITYLDQVTSFLKSEQFSCVINFAAMTNVDEAEKEKDNQNGQVYQVNMEGVKNISTVCKDLNIHLIQISTDYVFDGKKADLPYNEDDQPNPIGWYSQTKYLAEQEIKKSGCEFSIARIEMPYRARYEMKKDIARIFLGLLKKGNQFEVVVDQKITPVLVDDVANALGVLITKNSLGIYHLTPTYFTTPFDFAKMIAQKFGLDVSLIKPTTFAQFSQKPNRAPRPQHTWLSSKKFVNQFGEGILHSISEGLDLFKQQYLLTN